MMTTTRTEVKTWNLNFVKPFVINLYVRSIRISWMAYDYYLLSHAAV